MPYKITITETKAVVRECGKEWRVLGTREVAREQGFLSEGEPKSRVEEVHGYTPVNFKTVIEHVQVYEQTVEALDLKGVIDAVNAPRPLLGQFPARRRKERPAVVAASER